MMRHKTNRMYGIVLGSPFMMQFWSHIQSLCNPRPRQLQACVQLVEEIQSRTADGWKEVPLDAIKRVVDDLVEANEEGGNVSDPQPDALVADVTRLLEQRAKLKRLKAVSSSNTCLQGEEFRAIPILPTNDEMVTSDIVSKPLPINQIGRRYTSVLEYLETHFQLLREDYIEPLRRGINEYKNHHAGQRADNSTQELSIYVDVRFQPGVRFGREGIQYEVHFKVPNRREIKWDRAKRLMFGSLLCFSDDKFATHFWGVVASRSVDDLSKRTLFIRLFKDTMPKASPEDSARSELACCHWFEPGQSFVMVESTSAYFEAYAHVLKSLQREEMCRQLVFTKHLIDLEPTLGPPCYLASRPKNGEFSFASAFPELMTEVGRDAFDNILSTWPEWKGCALDDSQRKALKHGLTKELAIIQGPPGTGKTFVGLLLVRILLENLKKQRSSLASASYALAQSGSSLHQEDVHGPIMVVCYTNHALDQFLMGIHQFEKGLIRIGGRSKHEVLKAQSLTKLVSGQRDSKTVNGSHHRAAMGAKAATVALQNLIDNKYVPLLNKRLVDRNTLREVAAPQHIDSLLVLKNRGNLYDTNIVQIWLSGAPKDFQKAKNRKNARVPMDDQTMLTGLILENRYDTLGHLEPDRDEEATLQQMDPADAESIASEVKYQADEQPDEDREETPEADTIGHLEPDKDDDETLHQMDSADAEDEQQSENGSSSEESTLQHLTEEERQQLDLDDFIHFTDVWALPRALRLRLHELWLGAMKSHAKEHIDKLSKEYEEVCSNSLEVEKGIQLSLLRQANVVGMTTTAAARYHDMLVSLKSEIVIIEEAAEVLESHILASVSPHTRHLILIGDHQQLRPSVSVHRLAVKNKLDVSMFERLVTSGVEYRSLNVQRRMRPSISNLIKPLYPHLRDHTSVSQYPDVQGVMDNVFFLDHKEESSSKDSGTGSKLNRGEARIIVEFCLYLLSQGTYSASDITILSMYAGQVHEIKTLLTPRIEARWPAKNVTTGLDECMGEDEEQSQASKRIPRVSSVDDFQGEESDIILLSLVRSNHLEDKDGPGKIGFLSISNRVCVAISRARIGLYLFGNAELLSEKSEVWRTVIGRLSQSGLCRSTLFPMFPESSREGDQGGTCNRLCSG